MTQSGIVRDHVDPAIRPQDDLFGHVNGTWLATYEIPADRGSDGAFRELRDESERQVRVIIEAADGQAEGDGAPAHEERLIAALYASFMDTHRVDALGVRPLAEELDRVANVNHLDDLARLLGELERAGVDGLFDAWVDTDPGHPDRYIVNLGQGGLGLPDEAYYREPQHEPIRDEYVKHIRQMLKLLLASDKSGRRADAAPPSAPGAIPSDPAEAAVRVFELEKRIAAAHWDVVKDRDDTLTYNPMTLAEVKALAPSFPWETWATALGAAPEHLGDVIVREPSFFAALAELWPATPLADWQAWLTWHVVHSRAPYLPETFVQENFHFYGQVLQGTTELRDRWKRGVAFVQGCAGEAVGRRYTDLHFPPAHKERMVTLVGHLLDAYRQSITALTWLGEATKAKALAKLDQFTPKIGYPDKWRDYSALQADPDDLVGNVRASSAFETDRELAKLGQPVDRDEWFMTPQTVNAYYNPGMNEIVFPAAILQPPFFWADADDAANFGGIGAVIGHEIGHGFDDQGSKYDGTGRLVDWWTEADRAAFEERTKALIAQYDAFTIDLPDGPRHVNGALTIGENIGDLGGLSIAWQAYQLALGGAEAPVIDGMTAVERFFFGWAQVWRAKSRPEEAALRLAVDPHSPDRCRCNGVIRNLDLFHAAFGVTESDGLWLAPEERVTIW
ncbi:MAG: peptidase M13 [Propionibacteriaceae bacterium]|jgi:putative endopeptidase|nr:peptidase M13 [Propionibacteriaceae bacterium]